MKERAVRLNEQVVSNAKLGNEAAAAFFSEIEQRSQ